MLFSGKMLVGKVDTIILDVSEADEKSGLLLNRTAFSVLDLIFSSNRRQYLNCYPAHTIC